MLLSNVICTYSHKWLNSCLLYFSPLCCLFPRICRTLPLDKKKKIAHLVVLYMMSVSIRIRHLEIFIL